MFSNNEIIKICLCCYGNKITDNQSYCGVGLPQGTYEPNTYELNKPSDNRVVKVCHCYHGNKYSLATRPIRITIVQNDKFTIYELETTSNDEVMNV